MRTAGGLLTQLIVAITVMVLNLFFASVATLFRLLPFIMPYVLRGGMLALQLSRRFYFMILSTLTPRLQPWVKINLMQGLWRIGSTIVLSLSFGLLVYLLIAFPINGWTVLILVAHGLFVGLTWDELSREDGLTTGVKIP